MKRSYLLFIAMAAIAVTTSSGFAQTVDLTKPITPETRGLYEAYIKQHAPNEEAFVAVQRVAESYIQARQWEKAVEIFQTSRSLFPAMNRRFEKIIALLGATEEAVVVNNPGPAINTSAGEWDPTPTPDGKLLYFSAANRPDGYGGDDVFVSEYRDGKWQTAMNVGRSINAEQDETVDNVSADGNILFLSGTFPGTFGDFDIFTVEKTAEGWSALQHLPKPINSEHYDAGGSITSDGKALLFSSDRPGGIGEFHPRREVFLGRMWGNEDIYVCLRTENGWSEPINLGPMINTPYGENSAFLHPDGKTLYFSSDGHYGLGGLDLFKATRLRENSWTEWSEPVNLGKEINTAGNDWGYQVTTAGDMAFFSASGRKEGFGRMDIYSKMLQESPGLQVEILGHTDDWGSEAYNIELSKRRAQAVVDYLVSTGYNRANLKAKGYGKSKPVASNDTEDGRQQNRRVEFRILLAESTAER